MSSKMFFEIWLLRLKMNLTVWLVLSLWKYSAVTNWTNKQHKFWMELNIYFHENQYLLTAENDVRNVITEL